MFPKVQNYKKNAQLFGYLEKKNRGVEQLVARQAHNLEVARSNPASATRTRMCRVTSSFFCCKVIHLAKIGIISPYLCFVDQNKRHLSDRDKMDV